MWKSGCLADSHVDSVENLSTAIVENSLSGDNAVDNVENLSTAIVENLKSLFIISSK